MIGRGLNYMIQTGIAYPGRRVPVIPARAAVALTKGGTNHRLADRIVAAVGCEHSLATVGGSCHDVARLTNHQVSRRTYFATFAASIDVMPDLVHAAVRGAIDAR